MNSQIISIEIKPIDHGYWEVAVTKSFAPEHGGGSETFRNASCDLPHALELAGKMVLSLPPVRMTQCEHCLTTEGVTEDRWGNLLCPKCAAATAQDEYDNN
jgi:hypothetical protein